MARQQLNICYLTRKQNAIAPVASALKESFPRIIASQADSAENVSKNADLIIADEEFHGLATAVPVLYVVSPQNAATFAKKSADFVTKDELSTYAAVRAVRNILDRHVLSEELKDISIKDDLTGLYNQRFLTEILSKEVKKAVRYGYPLTLLYTGLDGIHALNTKFGHAIGDRVIMDFGLIASNSVRSVDTIGRFYGDEFLAILPETSQEKSLKVCERIQNATKNFAFANGEAGVNVTVSIGIASLSSSLRTKDELLNAVRFAMTGAKKHGADSICTWEDAKELDEPTKENKDLITAIGQQITFLTEETKKNHYNNILKLFGDIPLYRKMLSHSEHVAFYACRLAERLGLSGEEVSFIKNSALLHDIGKLAIDERIVMKGGPLTGAEYVMVKQHPIFGSQMLAGSPFIKNEVNIILHHHEFFDGNGYPDHMQGTFIPLGSRIIALAEGWDTMIASQPYREALALDKAIEELKNGAGHQFDPELVTIFTGMIEG